MRMTETGYGQGMRRTPNGRILLERGALLFDRDSARGIKNKKRIDFGGNNIRSTFLLQKRDGSESLLTSKVYSLYVLNTFDGCAGKAFDKVACEFLGSESCLNLLLIGNGHVLRNQIQEVMKEGIKVRVYHYVAENGYINTRNNKPIRLEAMLSS